MYKLTGSTFACPKFQFRSRIQMFRNWKILAVECYELCHYDEIGKTRCDFRLWGVQTESTCWMILGNTQTPTHTENTCESPASPVYIYLQTPFTFLPFRTGSSPLSANIIIMMFFCNVFGRRTTTMNIIMNPPRSLSLKVSLLAPTRFDFFGAQLPQIGTFGDISWTKAIEKFRGKLGDESGTPSVENSDVFLGEAGRVRGSDEVIWSYVMCICF